MKKKNHNFIIGMYRAFGLSTNDGDANISFLAEGNTFFKMLQKVDLEILGSCMSHLCGRLTRREKNNLGKGL